LLGSRGKKGAEKGAVLAALVRGFSTVRDWLSHIETTSPTGTFPVAATYFAYQICAKYSQLDGILLGNIFQQGSEKGMPKNCRNAGYLKVSGALEVFLSLNILHTAENVLPNEKKYI